MPAASVAAILDKQSDPMVCGCSRQGGVVNRREQRIISPTGQGALNMSRSLGDKAYKQPHRLVSCEPTVKSIELTCAVSYLPAAFCAQSSKAHRLPS